MNPQTNRDCPFCLEPIQPEARVCPHCRQWLTIRSLRHPGVALWFTGIPTLALLVLFGFAALKALDRLNPEPHYISMPNSLQVLESRMAWMQTSNGPRLYVTGILTNCSRVAWRGIEFECRFFDLNGTMVDAAHPNGYLTIQPNDDGAFRVSVTPVRPTNDYASFKLSVSSARNAAAWF